MEGTISCLFLKIFFFFNSLWYFLKRLTTFMGKRPTAWRTGARWGAAIQTCLIIQRALTAGITSGHISSSLCKLQLSTHLCSSRHTNGHHTEILLCWAASSLEGILGAGKSCYANKPWEESIPMPNTCWCSNSFISDCSRYHKTLCTLHKADI